MLDIVLGGKKEKKRTEHVVWHSRSPRRKLARVVFSLQNDLCMYVFMYVCTYVRMYVCMCVCMYVSMCVCMYVGMYVYNI